MKPRTSTRSSFQGRRVEVRARATKMFGLRFTVVELCRARRGAKIGRFGPLTRGIRPYGTKERNLDMSHSQFLAEAPARGKWDNNEDGNPKSDELDGVTNSRGKLSPTSSHLFKLILPLGSLSHPSNEDEIPREPSDPNSSAANGNGAPPTVILLHPSQPLSHVSRLILASLAPATPTISFRSMSSGGKAFQWSDSTDLGDFIRDAARAAEFTICISYGPKAARAQHLPAANQAEPRVVSVDAAQETKPAGEGGITETLLSVSVPTFADRTRFLRRRLSLIEGRLKDMEGLKADCNTEAHRGARKMAVGGFGILVVYWAAVARLTFWDYGWDIMEPITYLSGLSTVILGYLWFLYQGREVSYTSVLARSISARREALYKTRGLDIDRWVELVAERKALRAEIGRIAQDYEGDEDDEGAVLDGEKFYEAHESSKKTKLVVDEPDSEDVGETGAKEESGPDEGEDIIDADEQRGKKEAKNVD